MDYNTQPKKTDTTKSLKKIIENAQHLLAIQNNSSLEERGNAGVFASLHRSIQTITTSQIFVGIMMILMNIFSKHVSLKLPRSIETYLKYSFSRNFLVFVIFYLGTRDIFVALFLTLVFVLLMDYLLNEESMFCILPSSFQEYYSNIENFESSPVPVPSKQPTPEEINQAIAVLAKIRYVI